MGGGRKAGRPPEDEHRGGVQILIGEGRRGLGLRRILGYTPKKEHRRGGPSAGLLEACGGEPLGVLKEKRFG